MTEAAYRKRLRCEIQSVHLRGAHLRRFPEQETPIAQTRAKDLVKFLVGAALE
jgi:hypothetical protein